MYPDEYIDRTIEGSIEKALSWFPAVAILGPRQCGKSTLAKHCISRRPEALYLDLQKEEDRRKLDHPALFLKEYENALVCLDEIQQVPEMFPVLRSLIDENRRPGRFLILGSASRDLIQRSSESLAGRISYQELHPFSILELPSEAMTRLWVRGGFPDSYRAPDDELSYQWRRDFIRTFLERDLSRLGFNLPPAGLQRLWRLLAHSHGKELNYTKLGGILGVSDHTVRQWLEALEGTFMVRLLPPAERNLKKRLIKTPKVYIRDAGIFHALMEIPDYNRLHGSLVPGESWEGWALENMLAGCPDWRASYLKTSHGAEIDLVLERGEQTVLIEFKLDPAPRIGRGFRILADELSPAESWYVVPAQSAYPLADGVRAGPPRDAIRAIQALTGDGQP